MAPYGLYQLNPLTDPIFAWLDRTLTVRFDLERTTCIASQNSEQARKTTQKHKAL